MQEIWGAHWEQFVKHAKMPKNNPKKSTKRFGRASVELFNSPQQTVAKYTANVSL